MAAHLSIEFTDLECKVIVAEPAKNGRIAVKSVSSFVLPRPEDLVVRAAERTQALRDHLRSQRIAIKTAVVVIPKSYVMARSVTLPSTVDDEIAGMARFEADRHIPFNADRHIVSYHVLARQGMQGSDVLLAAVDQPIAKEYLDICVKAGLTVTSITVSSIAMFNAFAATEKTALADRTVLVLNIGKNATDLVIATNGNVNFTRGSTTGVSRLMTDLTEAMGQPVTISDLSEMDALEPQLYFKGETPEPPSVAPGIYDELPGQEDEQAALDARYARPAPPLIFEAVPAPSAAAAPENKPAVIFSDWLNKLLQEVRRTYEFASREFNCPMINHIYLCGEGAVIKRVADYFEANFHVTAAVFDPLSGAEVARKVLKNSEAPGQQYAVAIGGAVGRRPHTIHINLLPGSYTEARSAKRQQVSYVVTGVLALAALVAGYMFLSDAFSRKRALLDQIEIQNRADQGRVKDLRTKKDRLRIIRDNVQDDRGAIDVLRILSEKDYFPDQVALTSFDYKRGDFVKLQGDATDLQTANQLVNDLRNTGFFEDARLDNTVPNKQLRGRPQIPVLGWAATFTFPKPVKPKPKSSRPAPGSKQKEGDLDGIE